MIACNFANLQGLRLSTQCVATAGSETQNHLGLSDRADYYLKFLGSGELVFFGPRNNAIKNFQKSQKIDDLESLSL